MPIAKVKWSSRLGALSVALAAMGSLACALNQFGAGGGGGVPSESTGTTDSTMGPVDEGDPSVATSLGSGGMSMDGASTGVASTGVADTGGTGSSDGAADTTTTDSTTEAAESSSTGDVPQTLCPASADLAACYDFLGVGGGMLLDLSGNGNDAPAVGIGVVAGPFGDAATFDGSSEISVTDSPSLDIADAITVEAWIRTDAVPGSGRVGVLDNELQYAMTIQSSDEYRCGMAGAELWEGPVILSDWTHVACVYDGAALRLYINGVQLAMTPASGGIATGNGDPMSIGDTSPGFSEPFNGAIGGLRVWSVARTTEQLCDAAGDACGT